MNRRRFLTFSASSIAGVTLGACDSFGPKSATSLLKFAERKNEQLERWLFSSGSRNRVDAAARLSGQSFPRYYISKTIPMWSEAERGVWRIEAVDPPRSLELSDADVDDDGKPNDDFALTGIAMELSETDSGTRMTVRSMFFSRDGMEAMAEGFAEGLRLSLSRMDALLAEPASSAS